MKQHNPLVVLRGDHNECPTCGQLFNSGRAFDAHRTGSHAKGERRCLDVAEMLAAGMVRNAGGWWITGGRPAGIVNRDEAEA